jgi:hypothetical protein
MAHSSHTFRGIPSLQSVAQHVPSGTLIRRTKFEKHQGYEFSVTRLLCQNCHTLFKASLLPNCAYTVVNFELILTS